MGVRVGGHTMTRAFLCSLAATWVAATWMTAEPRAQKSPSEGAPPPTASARDQAPSNRQVVDAFDLCERRAERMLGQQAIRAGGSVRAPRQLRHVLPSLPELPPGTSVTVSPWLGVVLIDGSGKIVDIWPLRGIESTPSFPPLNDAISAAIRQWEFEPRIVEAGTVPVCMAVTVNVDW